MRPIALILALALAAPAFAQTQADPEATTGLAQRPLVAAERQMIVAAHPLAAQAGADMLSAGGSAADAAIAALLVLNVVEPQSSGIGGGAFALVHGPGGVTSWDARETAPMGATPDMFLAGGEPMGFRDAVASGRSVGVPGMLRLMEALHSRHGKLPWVRLFEPAIGLARDGFSVSPRLAAMLAEHGPGFAGAAAEVFAPGGVPLAEGAVLRQPVLAATLIRLAADGPAGFYDGPVARAIVAAVAAEPVPGTLSLGDLAAYRAIERPAICHPYLRYRVCGMGPPSSGATTVGQILMLVERAAPEGLALDEARLWHLFAGASRLAYADRARYLADGDFVDVPVAGLLDPLYMDVRAWLIHPWRAAEGPAEAGIPPWREGRLMAPDGPRNRPGTTHLSVIDADGLAISLTASIETAFGSGRMAAGFLLNNQLTDFSFRPVASDGTPIANSVEPGKRPRSSMAPTIVFRDGRPVVLTGSPGGSRIPEYVAQTLIAILAFDADPARAAALPHVSHRNGETLALEPWIDPGLADALGGRGHKVELREMTSGLHTIRIRPDGRLEGGADPRREGAAMGE